MAKRFYEFETYEQDTCPEENTRRAFLDNFEKALLMALLNKGILNQRQFELCLEELKRDKETRQGP